MIGVYKIVFPDGQFYIGSAYGKKEMNGRWDDHIKGRKNSPKYLQELAQKYGGWNCAVFIILRETKTEQRALLFEQAYINRSKNNPMLLNHNKNVLKAPDMSGENHPMFGLRGENNPNFGKHLSEETKKKMSEVRMGKRHTEETKKKISENHADFSGENHPMFGKHHSDKSKKKISEAKKGKRVGEDNHSAKLSWILVKEIREKYATGNFFQRQLAEEYGINQPSVSHIITNISWKEEIK
jgi:group I intron endonuclease